MPIAVLLTVLSALGLVVGLAAPALGGPASVETGAWIVAYAAGGWLGLRAAASELLEARIDIDLLMVLAALGALSIGQPFEGAMLLFLFSLSNVLQDFAIGRSRKAIQALMQLRPDRAHVRRGDEWVQVDVEEVEPGEVYLARPGDRLPLDGEIVDGRTEVDQASLTGESVPVSRESGDPVFGGTINGSGSIEVRVTKRASESAIARMIQLVEEAQEEKAETQQFLERFEQPYALGVLAMTAIAVALPVLAWGEAFDPAFYRAMTLMVAASPCALIISTPAAVLSAIAAGARNGVLFKGGVFVESLATVRAVAFDKTGTLTAGETRLVSIDPAPGVDAGELLRLVAAVQARSEHHLARATVRRAQDDGVAVGEVEDFRASPGRGVSGRVEGRRIHIGNDRFRDERNGSGDDAGGALAQAGVDAVGASAPADAPGAADFSGREGGGAGGPRDDAATGDPAPARAWTTVHVLEEPADGPVRPLGTLSFADTVRPHAARAVRALAAQGVVETMMITGDAQAVADAVAREVGITTVHAEVLPERKVELVRELRDRRGTVAMVGDGVNDAPALAVATVGIAMGGVGTDVAMETADVVLMSDDLDMIPWALELSRRARRTLIMNLGFALAVILVMIGFILTSGLPLPLAVVGHEGSTVLVSLNGLRLLLATPPHPPADAPGANVRA